MAWHSFERNYLREVKRKLVELLPFSSNQHERNLIWTNFFGFVLKFISSQYYIKRRIIFIAATFAAVNSNDPLAV